MAASPLSNSGNAKCADAFTILLRRHLQLARPAGRAGLIRCRCRGFGGKLWKNNERKLKMKTFEKLLDRMFDHKTIVSCDRKPYLKRWYLLRRKSFAFFLHRFHRSDEDRALHDHPWCFVTFILWRGYLEHTPRQNVSRKWPLMICFRRAEHQHRVELVDGKPAWTLILRFKEKRMWGFWTKNGFEPWNKWWQNNCE
jgi:hypothetical protein